MQSRAKVFLTSAETRRTFALYVLIGALGVSFYVVALWALLHVGTPYFAAFTGAFILGVSAQFMMNRYFNFRAFQRTVHHQAGTYAVVTVLSYLTMMGVVSFAMRVFHFKPVLAYLLSVPINLPVGYLANRYLTFGDGILSAVR